MLGRIVRSRDHHAGVRLQIVDAEIKHRRGSPADARDGRAGRHHSFGQCRLERGRRESTVESKTNPRRRSPIFGDHRGEGAADRQRVVDAQRRTDKATDIVLANDGGMEQVARSHSATPALIS